MKKQAFKILMRWVAQREMARRNKEAGRPFPYCDDEVINTYRFCNVIRMDDRVSQWLLTHWYLPNMGNNNDWFACAVARYFNWPDTLQIIGYPKSWKPATTVERLQRIIASGGKVFSAAYIIPAPGGTKKHEHVVWTVLDNLYFTNRNMREFPQNWTMREAHQWLMEYTGFGSFLAGQVVADWRHANVFSRTPTDAMTWAPLGPGSTRGINRLMGREANQSVHPESYAIMQEAFTKLRDRLDDPVVERMEMMDFQNCLCEYDKYQRTLRGEGTPKVRYVPNRGF
jgi:hypothetical protein